MFRDRTEAGLLLARKLIKYEGKDGVILAVPRGGVPVAYAVATQLGLPIDVILTKKIGHPDNKEYAIGAASLTDYFVLPHQDVTETYIQDELQHVRSNLKRMYALFVGDKGPVVIEGKTVIVIDDGIATGNTLLGTIRLLRKSKPAKIVIGVPVASRSAMQKIAKEVDDLVVVLIPDEFFGVGAFYENFAQVSDDEVLHYLQKLNRPAKAV